eukprot:comp21450_c0_seq2/m.46570 comp21450_c0_seq2/g.46570  ORF comp21450_c0_seq2/g.46570 comp21450_c0_seq2/m.46570 type:complete len:373 (-) comp21450_c0_seq2:173-1291(-)
MGHDRHIRPPAARAALCDWRHDCTQPRARVALPPHHIHLPHHQLDHVCRPSHPAPRRHRRLQGPHHIQQRPNKVRDLAHCQVLRRRRGRQHPLRGRRPGRNTADRHQQRSRQRQQPALKLRPALPISESRLCRTPQHRRVKAQHSDRGRKEADQGACGLQAARECAADPEQLQQHRRMEHPAWLCACCAANNQRRPGLQDDLVVCQGHQCVPLRRLYQESADDLDRPRHCGRRAHLWCFLRRAGHEPLRTEGIQHDRGPGKGHRLCRARGCTAVQAVFGSRTGRRQCRRPQERSVGPPALQEAGLHNAQERLAALARRRRWSLDTAVRLRGGIRETALEEDQRRCWRRQQERRIPCLDSQRQEGLGREQVRG